MFGYNGIVRLRNMTKQAWGNIDVQLKRRADLIPNVTRVVSGYATHEKTIFIQISRLRAQLIMQTQRDQVLKLDTQLSDSVKQLFALAENYPKLLANENYLSLQKELANTENQIAASRRIYNENVTLYNTAIETFPRNILANFCRFEKQELYSL